MSARKPTPEEIAAARDGTIADVIAPGLKVLFCGINPSLYSAAVGHHFARPGNRFWPALHAAGFTERRLYPSEQGELLRAGYGITNLAARATATADELSAEELLRGARVLGRKVKGYPAEPLHVAFTGKRDRQFRVEITGTYKSGELTYELRVQAWLEWLT